MHCGIGARAVEYEFRFWKINPMKVAGYIPWSTHADVEIVNRRGLQLPRGLGDFIRESFEQLKQARERSAIQQAIITHLPAVG